MLNFFNQISRSRNKNQKLILHNFEDTQNHSKRVEMTKDFLSYVQRYNLLVLSILILMTEFGLDLNLDWDWDWNTDVVIRALEVFVTCRRFPTCVWNLNQELEIVYNL